MRINHTIRFILQSVVLGLIAAFIILLAWPDLSRRGADENAAGSGRTGSYSKAVSRAAPAVVNVYASRVTQQQINPLFQDPLFQRFFGLTQPAPNLRRDSSLGSGVIMNYTGYTLTNAHVIQGMDEFRITLNDGRQANATIIGIDMDTDLAVLKIDLDNLPVISIGNSDELEVGDVVLAIGNPYDFGQTVTQGIVSAKGRKSMGITTFEDFIQTDADINPGNSGGALITANGQLVGINTAIVSNTGGSQGIGLATPVNMALNVMDQLIINGHVIRGWLGIEVQILPADARREIGVQQGGVLVAGVLKNGPADQAGIVPGDIILKVADNLVTSPRQIIEMVSGITPGTEQE
ncbi:MAG: trypsin-like peptidase domain-containing protein, partial [Gammaproteobacteria bacterium]